MTLRNGPRPFLALTVGAALLLAPQVAREAQAQYFTPFGKNKVRYEKFDWQIYESPHFKVYYYGDVEEELQNLVSLAESAYDRLSQELDFQIQERTPLILYETHSDFLQNNLIVGFIPEGVAAFATSTRFQMVMPIDMSNVEMYELLLHELTHIFQYYILFGGSIGRAFTMNPPTWLMEGMASYFAQDESTSDRMFLRDAVVNDTIPPITQSDIQGFFAYRFGHAAFDFMEERWGRDGVMDFLFEFRNTVGSRVGKAVEQAFGISAEDFDVEFRRWLRQKYLPALVASGEPSDFGRPFRTDTQGSQETSPAASPSGDLIAAFSTHKRDLDIVLFDAERRALVTNLTKGYETKFRNFVGQHMTRPRGSGSDIAFSYDGNQLAAFVRREAGYSLALVDVIKGGVDRIIDMDVEQQTGPAWHPSENKIAFAGNDGGEFDIFMLDLDTLEIVNLTADDIYDAGPSFSPDGEWIVFASTTGEDADLWRIRVDDPTRRYRVTDDDYHNVDPVYSPDGERIFYTSDRTGAENIFSIDLNSGEIRQYTDAITGCFMPTVLNDLSGNERLIYNGYWKGRYDLYEREADQPVEVVDTVEVDPEHSLDVEEFEPDIQVSIDEDAKSDKKGFRLRLEDADALLGVDSNQNFLGSIYLSFTDFLGDRRLTAMFGSVESFQNFNVWFTNSSRRMSWTAHLFDNSQFYIGVDRSSGFLERGRQAYRHTGARFTIRYPTSFYRRFEAGLGAIRRDVDYQAFAFGEDGQPILDDEGNLIPIIEPRVDEYPELTGAFVGDTATYGPGGPTKGHRIRFDVSYAPDLDESGTLTASIRADLRKYIPLTRRSLIATRLYAFDSEGNYPDYTIFGGLDTVRGFDLYSLSGTRAFYTNLELRFPLIDLFVTPLIGFQGIQGRIFLDIAGAWYHDVQSFEFWDSENSSLGDAVSSYGWGFSVQFFGLEWNFDWATRWDFSESGETVSSFWVGQKF